MTSYLWKDANASRWQWNFILFHIYAKKNTKMRYKRKSIDKWSAIGKFNRFLARVLNLLRDNCAVKNKIDFRPKFDSKFAHIISEY